MRCKKTYPSYKNPIILRFSSPGKVHSTQSVKSQLIEIQKRIMANEKDFQRKGDKIPAV